MCGIIGQINKNISIDRHLFEQMRDTLIHRGPDGFGLYMSEDGKKALGHRRLSLIDLSETGTQPIHNEDKTIWITVNGEIYNYKQLKADLIKKGHCFYTETDSEVIVHAYEEWGVDLFGKLKGMFALGIWDEKNNKLILGRDRFGIKPLFYFVDKERIIFASEIKGIIKDFSVPKLLNYKSFCNYFTYRYVPSPDTIWENIYKIPPAHYLVYDLNTISISKYWDIKCNENIIEEDEAINRVDELLYNSIGDHLLADVHIGTFLSGGYDSSALVYYQNKLGYDASTYSIGFENWKKSEHKYAKIVSDKFETQHYEKVISKDHFENIDDLLYFYDEPIADISILPTYMVCRIASQKVKAVVSGEGADEIFAGYNWQTDNPNNYDLKSKLYYLYNNYLKGYSKDFSINDYANSMAMGLYDSDNLKKLLNKDLAVNINENPFWFYLKFFKEELSETKRFQYLDINTFMQELILTKVDRASMANSLEVRVPFLDHELVEFVFGLNEKVYLNRSKKKFLLYENIYKHLPQVILNRKKQGFVGPDRFYNNKQWYKQIILEGRLIKDSLIEKNEVVELLTKNDYWRLWKIAIMELWYSKWN